MRKRTFPVVCLALLAVAGGVLTMRSRVAPPIPAVVAPKVIVAAASPAPTPEDDPRTAFPPAEMPAIATASGARISLKYLAGNGADLSKPMPSKHRVFAANEKIAAQLAAWARAHGFDVRGPSLLRSHTGRPQQIMELVRLEVPVPENIEQEGRLILAATQQIPGTYYQTWSGEIVR